MDQERLLFVRLLSPSPQDPEVIQDIRFNEYRPLGGGWIAPEVLFLVDAREMMREEYFDIAADVELPERLFDPAVRTPAP